MYIMLTVGSMVEIALITVIILRIYFCPRWLVAFFNSTFGRFVLIYGIVMLTIKNTLWGLLGVLLLVSFREEVVEGMENMDEKKDDVDETETEMESEMRSEEVEETTTQEQPAGVDKDMMAKNDNEPLDDDMSAAPKTGTPFSPSEWRSLFCMKDSVMMDGKPVPMSELSDKFPNMSFPAGTCNPCHADCSFKLTSTKSKLETDEKLKAKPSNSLPTPDRSEQQQQQ